jgi:23S rRNA pseudouridine2604 synthase
VIQFSACVEPVKKEIMSIRVNKLIAASGLCSRRQADQYIENGWIRLIDAPTQALHPGLQVPFDSKWEFLPAAWRDIQQKVSLVLHKPVGYVSSQPNPSAKPSIQLLTNENEWKPMKSKPQQQRKTPRNLSNLAVAGRLDLNSSGLLLFTQQGALAKAVIGPNSRVEKEYLVRVRDPSSNVLHYDEIQERIHLLRQGIQDRGDFLQAVSVDVLNEQQIQFVLHAGKHHHLRRMCAAVGWHVEALKRVRIGTCVLGGLPLGKWRYLNDEELAAFLSPS